MWVSGSSCRRWNECFLLPVAFSLTFMIILSYHVRKLKPVALQRSLNNAYRTTTVNKRRWRSHKLMGHLQMQKPATFCWRFDKYHGLLWIANPCTLVYVARHLEFWEKFGSCPHPIFQRPILTLNAVGLAGLVGLSCHGPIQKVQSNPSQNGPKMLVKHANSD